MRRRFSFAFIGLICFTMVILPSCSSGKSDTPTPSTSLTISPSATNTPNADDLPGSTASPSPTDILSPSADAQPTDTAVDTPVPTVEVTPTEIPFDPYTAYIKATDVNFRSRPTADGNTPLKQLQAGQAVTVLQVGLGDGDWSSVTVDGEEGYISSQYLTKRGESAPTPSPTPTPTPTPSAMPTGSPVVVGPSDTSDSEQSLKGLLIGIDAGHQSKGNYENEPQAPGSSIKKAKVSSGTAGKYSGVAEYKVTLDVALLLQNKLTALGATVLMVRTTNDVNIPNSERATMMNDAGADLVIRIHADGSENTSTYGASMLVPSKGSNPVVNASVQAGKAIMQGFIAATGAKDRGVVPRSDLTGFNWSTVPVCLIEMGFMSNKDEDYMLIDPAYQEKCAQGLANGVVSWAKGR